MGTVWRARQVASDGRVVALKRVPAGDPLLAERLRREGRALARLDHPHVVRVLEIVPDGDGVVIAMQYAPGGSLADRLARQGRLAPGDAVAVLAPIADALGSAHRHGIVHRDVKPSNILFTSDGEPLLSDFGIARSSAERPLTAPDVRGLGTAEYLDPAVADGATPDARSDVYALGTVAYEVLAGRRPFAGGPPLAVLRAADRGQAPPLGPDVPPALARVVATAMARDPRDRYPDAGSFADALRAAAPAPTPRAPRPLPRAGRFGPARTPDTPTAGPASPATTAVTSAPDGSTPADGATTPGGAVAASPVPAAGVGSASGGGRREPPTTEFGPRPPRPGAPAPPVGTRRSVRRWVVVGVVAAALLLVPVLVVLAIDRGAPPAAAPPPAAQVAPARVCPPLDPPAAAPGQTVLTGDLAGDGCPSWLRWGDGVLEAALERGAEPRRYELGEPGDVPVLGDWDCDGRPTPGLYRPPTGEVFLFDDWADPDAPLRSRPAQATGVPSGTPRVVPGDGCDRVEVTAP